ncbi:hypothetical protein PbB2_00100 [Candidatus Phycosocius bacilliformis]|uniref:Bacteriophage phiJL001 Gp84 N-terminal domain-containing protein n=1 Tax=Candidatus Phycosocius bacilliformis TaxID=1445552 RepID=A0A2P2E5W7_9PROT|nr:hypothetical protein [Candidatus Phycosocius bacilliformis]GBF56444.1 hypothetical protein PbB2_00100 [Candidatus Phycosocius bacilliformis]
MALALTTPQRNLLRSRNIGLRMLVQFTFGANIYRFTDDEDTIVWNGFNWLGAGQIATISARALTAGSSADGVTITVNGAGLATPDDPSAATLLATIYAEAKQWDRVDMFLLYFDAATGVPVFQAPFLIGRLAGAPLLRQPGAAAQLQLEIEADDIILDRAPGRTRSDSDQRRMWPVGGGGFHLAGAASAQAGSVWWGQDAPAATVPRANNLIGRVIQRAIAADEALR